MQFLIRLALGAAISSICAAEEAYSQANSAIKPQLRPRGMLTMRTMTLANTGAEGSTLYFGDDFAMGTDTAANFALRAKNAEHPLLMLDSANTLRIGSPRVEALSVDAQGGVVVRGVKQWELAVSEDFALGSVPAGWSRSELSQCGGITMLGGFCKFSRGVTNKTFTGLPPHKRLRIVANFHFIDQWIGESGYMKLNIGVGGAPIVVWTEQHSQEMSKNGISVCGKSETPEGKFAVPIDITIPHHESSIEVEFGSTMDDSDACDESWGISGLELLVRE